MGLIHRAVLTTIAISLVLGGEVAAQATLMNSRHNSFQMFAGYGGDDSFSGFNGGLGVTLGGKADLMAGISVESGVGMSLTSLIHRFEYVLHVRPTGKSRLKLTFGETLRLGFSTALRSAGDPDNWSRFRLYGASYLEYPLGGRAFVQPGVSLGWGRTTTDYADDGVWGEMVVSLFSRGAELSPLWGLTGSVLFPIGLSAKATFGVRLFVGFPKKMKPRIGHSRQ